MKLIVFMFGLVVASAIWLGTVAVDVHNRTTPPAARQSVPACTAVQTGTIGELPVYRCK